MIGGDTRRIASEGLLYTVLSFGVFAFATSEPWSVGILQILIALLLIATAWSGELAFVGPAQRWIALPILSLVIIGTLQFFNERAITDPRTGLLFTTSAWATKKSILLWLSYATVLVAASSIVNEFVKLRRLAWAIFLIGVAVAILGLGFKSEHTPLLLGLRPMSHANPAHFGPFVNRDHAASLLAMSGMVGWGILLSHIVFLSHSRSRSELFDRLAKSALILGMIAALAFCIVKTGSRGGTHAFFISSAMISVAFALSFFRGRKLFFVFLFFFALSGIYGYLLYIYPHWRGYVDGELVSQLKWRISMYQSGITMLLDFPFFGSGLGAFSFGFPLYQATSMGGFVRHIHSDWLQVALETGLIGLLILVGGISGLVSEVFRRWTDCPSREVQAITAGVVGALLAVSIHMLMDFPFQMPGNAITVMLLASILSSQSLRKGIESSVRTYRSLSKRSGFWVVAVALLLVTQSVSPIAAEFHYFKARRLPLETRIYYLTKALHWDANPKYAVYLGLTYQAQSQRTPDASRVLARHGLNALFPFRRRYPVHHNLRAVFQRLLRQARSGRVHV